MEPRHVVIGILIVGVSLVSGWRAVRSSGPEQVISVELPVCESGIVAVSWPGDGERVGCLEELGSLLLYAATQAGCEPKGDPSAVKAASGQRVRVEADGDRICRVTFCFLSGSELLALNVPIDLNRAGIPDLMALRGIGPVRARAIVDDRAELGDFRSVDDLARVRGIGPVTLERIAPYVVAGKGVTEDDVPGSAAYRTTVP